MNDKWFTCGVNQTNILLYYNLVFIDVGNLCINIPSPFYLHSSVADSFLQTDSANYKIVNHFIHYCENWDIYLFTLLFQAQMHCTMLNPNHYIDNFV